MELGPRVVVVKQGEYGSAMYTADGVFGLPAYPTADVVDPTGAGDTFAGGFVGYVAAHADEEITDELLRRAMAYGTALASFNVEAFGTERMQTLTPDEVNERVGELRAGDGLRRVTRPAARRERHRACASRPVGAATVGGRRIGRARIGCPVGLSAYHGVSQSWAGRCSTSSSS